MDRNNKTKNIYCKRLRLWYGVSFVNLVILSTFYRNFELINLLLLYISAMDRALGGNFLTNLLIKNRHHVHRLRVKKIKNRAPGTSKTLDNRRPEVIKALVEDPRKIAVRQHISAVRERENKTLLKRIGQILTAPPTITDADYQEMKRRIQRIDKNPKQRYETELKKKQYEKYRRRLKTLNGCYNVKEWEEDYERQLQVQKFMRQVKYDGSNKNANNGPEDDPAGLETDEDDSIYENYYNGVGTLDRSGMPSSHINRLRNMKSEENRPKSGSKCFRSRYFISARRKPKPAEDPYNPMKRLMKKEFTLSSAGFEEIEKERQRSYQDVYNVVDLSVDKKKRGQNKKSMSQSAQKGIMSSNKNSGKKAKTSIWDSDSDSENGDGNLYGALAELGIAQYNNDEDDCSSEGDEQQRIELLSVQRQIRILTPDADNRNNKGRRPNFSRKFQKDINNARQKLSTQVEADISCWYYFQSQALVIVVTSDLPSSSNTIELTKTEQIALQEALNSCPTTPKQTSSASITSDKDKDGDASTIKDVDGKSTALTLDEKADNVVTINEMVDIWRKNNDDLEFIQAETELSLIEIHAKHEVDLLEILDATKNRGKESIEGDSDLMKRLELIAMELINCVEIVIDKEDAIIKFSFIDRSGSKHLGDSAIDSKLETPNSPQKEKQGNESKATVSFAENLVSDAADAAADEYKDDYFDESEGETNGGERVLNLTPSVDEFEKYLLDQAKMSCTSTLDIPFKVFNSKYNPKTKETVRMMMEEDNINCTVTVTANADTIDVSLIANTSSKLPKKIQRVKSNERSRGLLRPSSTGSLGDTPNTPNTPSVDNHSHNSNSNSNSNNSNINNSNSNSSKSKSTNQINIPSDVSDSNTPMVISAGDQVSSAIPLPSVVRFDVEYLNEFIRNLSKNVILIHEYETGINEIKIGSS